jgi:transglutaminase-like putative cysteine protease
MRGLFLSPCLVMVLALGASAGTVTTSPRHFPAMRNFEFTYHVQVTDLPTGSHVVRIWIPVASADRHQSVTLVKVSSSVPSRITREPEFGNRMLYAEIRAPRSSDAEFTLVYRVTRWQYSKGSYQQLLRYNNDPEPLSASLRRYLDANRMIPIGGKMQAIADQVTRGRQGPVEIAHAAYNYLFDTMRYDKSGTGWGRGDAIWACNAKHGNCTDFHSAFIGILRNEKIPARFVIGFPLPENLSHGMIPGYHCWAEFYVPQAGWVPVDISEAWLDKKLYAYYFGTVGANRVRMSAGRDITLVPKQAGAPLNYFVYPYVEVDGKPFDKIRDRFTFKDLTPTRRQATLRPGSGPN